MDLSIHLRVVQYDDSEKLLQITKTNKMSSKDLKLHLDISCLSISLYTVKIENIYLKNNVSLYQVSVSPIKI